MGLDMYLTRKIYIESDTEGILALKLRGKQLPLDLHKIKYIEEDAGYWRKANQIHKWFVDKIQEGNDDCGQYDIDIEDLEELLDKCKEIKEKAILIDGQMQNGNKYNPKTKKWDPEYTEGKIIKNSEEIAGILPTQGGFFFGSTEYNEYYMEDIEQTIEIIEEQIKRDNELKEAGLFTYLYYSSSW